MLPLDQATDQAHQGQRMLDAGGTEPTRTVDLWAWLRQHGREHPAVRADDH